MIDPKQIGVPNICFSLTEGTDAREPAFLRQRLERGFDDSETWSLRDTIANFIIPRLERYEEKANGFLQREESEIRKIALFLEAMKLIVKDDGACLWDAAEKETVEKGLAAFPDIFMGLWW